MRKATIAALVVVACMAPPHAGAILAPIALSNLVAQSQSIVVAHVEKVSYVPTLTGGGKLRVDQAAILRVEETWKGPETNRLEVSVGPTWTCDMSTAQQGENALFFLVCDRRTSVLRIGHDGRGRMPIWHDGGKTLASFWWEVGMPNGLEVLPGQDPRDELTRAVRLESLKHEIKRICAKQREENSQHRSAP